LADLNLEIKSPGQRDTIMIIVKFAIYISRKLTVSNYKSVGLDMTYLHILFYNLI